MVFFQMTSTSAIPRQIERHKNTGKIRDRQTPRLTEGKTDINRDKKTEKQDW